MDTVSATRQLVRAIGDFTRVYENDTRFRDVVAQLRDTESSVEKLVPAAHQDSGESPGRRAAREAAQAPSKAPTASAPAKGDPNDGDEAAK
jgi:hypothetical protein